MGMDAAQQVVGHPAGPLEGQSTSRACHSSPCGAEHTGQGGSARALRRPAVGPSGTHVACCGWLSTWMPHEKSHSQELWS